MTEMPTESRSTSTPPSAVQPAEANHIDSALDLSTASLRSSFSSASPSINDDLVQAEVRSIVSSRLASHTRNMSDGSYSFLHSVNADTPSSLSLGNNKLSAVSVSPLGPNSVYELVENTNYRRRATATGLLTIVSSPTSINIKGPTTRDIPPTTLSPIDKVRNDQFNAYLHSVEEPYDEFHSHKTLTESTLEAFMTELSNEEKQTHKNNDSANSNYGGTEDEKVPSDSLKNVPDVFFSEDFRLDDPRTFNKVIGDTTILSGTVDYDDQGRQKPQIDNAEVQERLSSYLEIVEIHLIHEISKSSGSFFSALGDLRDITNKSAGLTGKLNTIDENLEGLSKDRAEGAIDLLKLARRRNNVEKLEQGLLQINTVLHHADLAESSYFNANYDKTLELTDAVFALIRGNEPPNQFVTEVTSKWPWPLLDMSKLPALAPLRRMIKDLVSDTGKSYAKLFGDYLVEDLRNNYENANSDETIMRMANGRRGGSSNSYDEVAPEFKEKVAEYIKGLARCNELPSAYKLYEEKFMAELKAIIRSHLPTDILEGSNSGSVSSSTATYRSGMGGLSNNVRAMTPREFEEMLVGTYTQLSVVLRRLLTHKRLLLTAAMDCVAQLDSQIMETQPDLVVKLDITDSVVDAINVAQRRMAKIINVRELQNSQNTLGYFLRLYNLNRMFVNECELISGGRVSNPVLADVMRIQFQKFSVQYHAQSMQILTNKVEKEIWRESILSSTLQRLVNQIMESSADEFDGSVWTRPLNLNLQSDGGSLAEDTEATDRKTLSIAEESFILPDLVSTVVGLVRDYETLKLQFPGVDSTATNMAELLKMLNLKIHRSVLGIQATKTAGLRNITSKNLAVTSQLLGFLASLTPYVKKLFARTSRSSKRLHVEEEFDKVQKVFSDQQNEIFDKLVTIMVDRVNSQSSEILATDWSHPLPQQQAHHYMDSLVSKTLTIARIVQRYLPETQYTLVLSNIFDRYKSTLTEIYGKVRLNDSVDKAVMLRDVDYFREKLVDVAGYGNSGQIVWENVNAMDTEEDKRMQRVMQERAEAEKKERERQEEEEARKAEAKKKEEEERVKKEEAEENAKKEEEERVRKEEEERVRKEEEEKAKKEEEEKAKKEAEEKAKKEEEEKAKKEEEEKAKKEAEEKAKKDAEEKEKKEKERIEKEEQEKKELAEKEQERLEKERAEKAMKEEEETRVKKEKEEAELLAQKSTEGENNAKSASGEHVAETGEEEEISDPAKKERDSPKVEHPHATTRTAETGQATDSQSSLQEETAQLGEDDVGNMARARVGGAASSGEEPSEVASPVLAVQETSAEEDSEAKHADSRSADPQTSGADLQQGVDPAEDGKTAAPGEQTGTAGSSRKRKNRKKNKKRKGRR